MSSAIDNESTPLATDQPYDYPDVTMTYEDHVLVPTVWGVIMALGLCGNLIVTYVMLRYADSSATNCFVVNLALTDLAFTVVVIPLTMTHYILPSWNLGVASCKFYMYTTYVLLFATCLTLTAMTVDRYFSICHPIASLPRRTPRTAVVVNVISWAASLLMSVPFAVYHELQLHDDSVAMEIVPTGQRITCSDAWPSKTVERFAYVYVVAVTYVIPLALILFCYSRVLRHLHHQHQLHARNPFVAKATVGNGSPTTDASATDVATTTTTTTTTTTNRSTISLHPAQTSAGQVPIQLIHSHVTDSLPSAVSQLALRRALTSGRRRRKATKMVAVIVVMFAVSWLPIHVFHLWYRFQDDFPKTQATYVFKIVAHAMSYANSSCINPVIYCLLGDGFRKALVRWWPRAFGRHQFAAVPQGGADVAGTTDGPAEHCHRRRCTPRRRRPAAVPDDSGIGHIRLAHVAPKSPPSADFDGDDCDRKFSGCDVDEGLKRSLNKTEIYFESQKSSAEAPGSTQSCTDAIACCSTVDEVCRNLEAPVTSPRRSISAKTVASSVDSDQVFIFSISTASKITSSSSSLAPTSDGESKTSMANGLAAEMTSVVEELTTSVHFDV